MQHSAAKQKCRICGISESELDAPKNRVKTENMNFN